MKRLLVVVPLFAAVLTVAPGARALEPGALAGEPVSVDITEAGSLLYNFDNRNFRAGKAETAADDRWGMFYNRLNLQASWGKWQAGLRLDAVWFFTSRSADQIAERMLEHRPPPLPGELRPPGDDQAYYEAQRAAAETQQLDTRFQSLFYPAKYYLTYATPDLDATVGDVYAQLGRGLVLSARKYDEISSDVTVRGGRVTGHLREGAFRLDATAVGGALNPLRIDEASGRVLTVRPSGRLFGRFDDGLTQLAEAGMPRPRDGAPTTYFTDRVAAGQLEAGTRLVTVGARGAFLFRDNPSSGPVSRTDARTFGASVSLPDLGGYGAAYLEIAHQQRRSVGVGEDPEPGNAIYGSVSLIEEPVTVLLEGKHYRGFYPLGANIDDTKAGEFRLVQYNAPPTTESIYTDTEFNNFNTCVTGGRVKTDVAVSDDDTLYAWVGRYDTWAEFSGFTTCDTVSENHNGVWDVAVGLEKTMHRRRSRANVVLGARDDRTDVVHASNAGPTRVFYREEYGRYDIIAWLTGPFSLQLQGWHRYRFEPQAEGEPWFEGEHLTGLQWAPRWIVAAGVEYDTRPSVPGSYFNGQVRYNFTSDSSLALFVGQRRGALRCVSGVCRVFPPFEGARLDVTARF